MNIDNIKIGMKVCITDDAWRDQGQTGIIRLYDPIDELTHIEIDGGYWYWFNHNEFYPMLDEPNEKAILIRKLQKAENKVATIKKQLDDLNKFKLSDIQAGAIFDAGILGEVKLIAQGDMFLLGGLYGNFNSLYSDNPKSSDEMLNYLNYLNAEKETK